MKNKILKYILTNTLLLTVVVAGFAQDAGEAVAQSADTSMLTWLLENIVIVMAAGVIIAAFLAMFYMNHMLLQAQKIQLLREHGVEVE